jgi:septal ring factor EnvC (AmiA/AmiB activator)
MKVMTVAQILVRLTLCVLIIILVLMLVGCQEDQMSTRDKIMQIEQEQTQLSQSVAEDKTKRDMMEVRLEGFTKDVDLLNEKVTNLTRQFANFARTPQKLIADIDANRVYLKAVRDELTEMRAKTIEMLGAQNERITEGHKVYVRVLEKEMELLSVKLEQLKNAVGELNTAMPDVDEEFSSVESAEWIDEESDSQEQEAQPENED